MGWIIAIAVVLLMLVDHFDLWWKLKDRFFPARCRCGARATMEIRCPSPGRAGGFLCDQCGEGA